MNPRERAVQALMARVGGGARLGLERMKAGLQALGSPHERFPCVHIAGTNGKGSVCAMVESIARHAGLRTGLYTSPHLCRFNERIRIDGAPIDDASFAVALGAALDVPNEPLSFFETLTAAAFKAFANAEVDLAIVEVGLGGRLDATNIFDHPLCTAITAIGRDHTSYLGDDLASIAAEKAAITRAGVPTVCGPVADAAWHGIERVLSDRGPADVWRVGTHLQHGGAPWAISGPDGQRVEATLSLAGRHQQDNAAVATGIAWRLADRFALTDHAIQAGLANSHWPGRLERLDASGVPVLLDCAHNVEAVEALCDSLTGTAGATLVFGAMDDKPWRAMLTQLAPHFAHHIYTEPLQGFPSRVAAPPHQLAAVHPGEVADDASDALTRAVEHRPPLVVVTGSAYLVGAARALLLQLPCDTIVPL